MIHTIMSAQYSNAELTAITIITEEAGAVSISEKSHPEEWQRALAGTVAAPQLPDYRELRAAAYPPIGDQLDALWKGGQDAADMKALIDAVKADYPK